MRSTFLLLALLLIASAGFGQTVQTTPTGIDAEVEALRAEFGLPAVAAAIVRTDGTVHKAASGVRIFGKPERVRIDDKFHVGSVGKSMTATMIATLVDEGKLKWSTTIGDVFGYLGAKLDAGYRDVTLEQLLSHRGGVAPFEEEDSPEWKALPALTGSPEQIRLKFTELLLAKGPASKVGEHVYSNAGYCIAAVMAERVTHKSWDRLMRERLFKRAGLASAGFGWPARYEPNQPWGHKEVAAGGFEPQTPTGEYQLHAFIAPAGDMHMNIGDFARYALLHLQGLRAKPRLLKADTFKKLHTPIGEYSLGWNRQLLRGLAADTHSGSAGTFYAGIVMVPEKDIAVVILINDSGAKSNEARNKLFGTLLRKYQVIT